MKNLQMQHQSQKMPQRHLYSGKQLATFAIASAVSMLLISGDIVFLGNLGGASGPIAIIGLTIYLLVVATITAFDWRGFLTMNGLLKWKSMSGNQRLIVGCLFVALNVFVLGSYLVQAYRKYRHYQQLEPLRRRRKLAEQEAELGMIPQTDGNCHNCQKPLQLGKEFCPYCGESVTERPRICPVCYATTQPDARWCPECRSQLDSTDSSY
jgi:RNA polymerase subunit RPABC4/transcription elongation factor Spt4